METRLSSISSVNASMSVGSCSHKINQNLEVLEFLSRPKLRCVANSSTTYRKYSQSQFVQASTNNCDATEREMRRRWSKRVEKFQLPSRRSAGKIKSRRANLEVVTAVKPRRCTDGAIGAFRGDEASGSSSWHNLNCVDVQ